MEDLDSSAINKMIIEEKKKKRGGEEEEEERERTGVTLTDRHNKRTRSYNSISGSVCLSQLGNHVP